MDFDLHMIDTGAARLVNFRARDSDVAARATDEERALSALVAATPGNERERVNAR